MGTPLLLTCMGRILYPQFLFCMVWGYHYTRNRKKYLLRLYIGSPFMTVFSYAIDYYLPTDGFGYGNHNIFLNMFWVGVLISTVEMFQKDRKKGGIMLGAIFAVQILYCYTDRLLHIVFPAMPGLSGDTLTGIIPNIFLNEYGFDFIALGVLMYFLKEKRTFSASCILFSVSPGSVMRSSGENWESLYNG